MRGVLWEAKDHQEKEDIQVQRDLGVWLGQMEPLESRGFKESWDQREIRVSLAPLVLQGPLVLLVRQVRPHTPQKRDENVVRCLELVQGK